MKPILGDRILVVQAYSPLDGFDIGVNIGFRTVGGDYDLAHFNEKGKLVFKHIEAGLITRNPTMRLTPAIASEIVRALQEVGVKNSDESKIQGLYEAQSKHLLDMRRIVFKSEEVNNAVK